jgi:hypothetical protein
VDGSNALFTLSATPDPVSSLTVYRNGLLMKANADYTLNARNIRFVSVAVPRVAGSDAATPQPFPAAQVLCNGVGGTTSSTTLTSLGLCSIPAGVRSAGNRVEIRFHYQHVGAVSGFNAEVRWGGSLVVHRDAPSTETSMVGRAEAGVFSTVRAVLGRGADPGQRGCERDRPYTSGLTIDFRGALAQSSGDALTLRNFTVVRLP